MAPLDRKFRVWIVLCVAFIPLSVLANPVQSEGQRCYWCGPLAEQVHRSTRAAKCNGDKSKITVCDDGLPYCAIVASSPPYVESRYCVKFYQDECYPLYCNTTNIWKVICPCRGELCNGPNTKRENEVFEALHKLTHTQRLKRALISNVGFMGITRKGRSDNSTIGEHTDNDINHDANKENVNTQNIIMEGDNGEKSNTDISETEDSTVHSEVSIVKSPISHNPELPSLPEVDTTASYNTAETLISSGSLETSVVIPETLGTFVNDIPEMTCTNKNLEHATSTESNSDDTIVKEAVIAKQTSQAVDPSTVTELTIDNNNNEPSIAIEIPASNIQSDDLKTDITVMSDTPILSNDTKLIGSNTEMNHSIHSNIADNKSMGKEIVVKPNDKVKSNETNTQLEGKFNIKKNIPAAETVQHAITTTTKTAEETTTKTNIKSHRESTISPRMSLNNTAVLKEAHILAMVVGLILQY